MVANLDAYAKAPQMSVPDARQRMASVAHSRGAVVTRNGVVLRPIEAAELMRLVREAYDGAGARRDQVETIIRSIAIGIRQTGPLSVAQSALNLLHGFAGRPVEHQRRRRRAA